MKMRTRHKTKKALSKIIRQGYDEDTQELFNIIFEVIREEFREDNLPTLTNLMLEKTRRSFEGIIMKNSEETKPMECKDCIYW